MAKKDEKTEDVIEMRPVQVIPVKASKKVSFEVWCQRRGVKEQHKRGMKAYVNKPGMLRTLEAWDRLFQDY